MDYGNTEVISLRSIVFLSHEILSLVPFAQLYCLHGMAVTNSDLYDKVQYILEILSTNSPSWYKNYIYNKVCNFNFMFSTDNNGREYINFRNLVQDEYLPARTNLLFWVLIIFSLTCCHFPVLKLFLCSFLQGVDMIHNLTDGKLLTVKLKETKKSLDSMWIKFKSVRSESLPDF